MTSPREIQLDLSELRRPPQTEPSTEQPREPAQRGAERSPPSAARDPQRSHARAERAVSPPALAQASSIVARDVDPNAPVDFSGETFVTGRADAYAGGASVASGTSSRAANRTSTTSDPTPRPQPTAARSLARSVELPLREWQCPWPHEAELAEFDTQTVTLRVRVDSEGRANTVTLIDHPGSGFGAAARACALETRFSPARDREGNAITADSPPIRVRFTR
jgi:protein TonB